MPKFGLIWLILVLGGCGLLPEPRPAPPPLLPPASFGKNLQVSQLLEIATPKTALTDAPQQLLIVVAIDHQQLRVTGLTPAGQRLMNITYDGQRVQANGTHRLPEWLTPQTILSQLQLAHWPLAALQHNYSAPWQLSGTSQQRQLSRENQPIVTVDYTSPTAATFSPGQSINLYDHRFDVSLTIRTLNVHIEASE